MADGSRYTRTAITLHWLVALLIFFGWSIGLRISDMPPSPDKLTWVNWHKWLGVTIFTFAVLRVVWRSSHPAPALPAGMPRWQLTAAHVSHFLLYLLVLAIPVTGWLMSSAKGFQTVWFGVVPLPDLLDKNRPLGEFLEEIHGLLAWTLAAVVAVHIAAAVKHHFVDRDDVLRRMLPMLAVIALLGAAAGGRVDAAGSRISATFRQQGVSVDVPFRDFLGRVSFNPKNPAGASAELEVETGSLDFGDAEYNDEVRKPEWFDAAKYPKATFVSSKIAKAGPGRYVASGTLTLKGHAAPVDVRFTAQRGKGRTVYAGEFPLSRKAFDIGGAGWDGTLEDKVLIKFRIVAANT